MTGKRKRRWFPAVWIVGTIFIGVFVWCGRLAGGAGIFTAPQVIWRILAGWLFYILRTVPRIEVDRGLFLHMALAVAASLLGLHLLMRKAMGDGRVPGLHPWRLAATLKMAGLLLLAFPLCVGVAGLGYQLAWLGDAPSPFAVAWSGRTESVICGVRYGLELYAADHGGLYPPRLRDVFPEYISWGRALVVEDAGAYPPEPFHYFRGHSVQDAPKTIVVASPYPYGDIRVTMSRYGMELLSEDEYARRLQSQGDSDAESD